MDGKPTKRAAKLAATWLITVSLFALLLLLLWDEKEKFSGLLAVSPSDLALLTTLWVLLSIPRGLIRKSMAKALGAELSFADWYGLPMVTNLVSVVLPARGDFVLAAVYLKKKYGLAMTHFGSLLYANALLLSLVLGAEGLVALTLLGVTHGVWRAGVWAILLAVAIAPVPFMLLSPGTISPSNWFLQRLHVLLQGWCRLRSTPGLILKLSFLIFTNSLFFWAWMYFSYRSAGFEVGALPVFFAAIVTQMSFFFSLTPGNLGVRETLVGFISDTMGLGFAEGVAVTILQRAISTVIFLLFGAVFAPAVLRGLLIETEEPTSGDPQHP